MFSWVQHTPRWAYEEVLAKINADGTTIACVPLINWLRAACIRIMINGANLEASLLAQLHPGALVADAELQHH